MTNPRPQSLQHLTGPRRWLVGAALVGALVVPSHDLGAARPGSAQPRTRQASALIKRAAGRAGVRSFARSLRGKLRFGRLRPGRVAARSQVLELPRKLRFEGGDLLPLPQPRPVGAGPATPLKRGVVIRTVADAKRYNIQRGTSAPIYFLGHGYRTSVQVAQKLADQLGAIVVTGKLTDPRFFHADTALGIFPDGVTFYKDGFAPETGALLRYLYPGRVHEVSEGEAEKLATNGRIIKKGTSVHNGRVREEFNYFYTADSFAPGFFEDISSKYPGSKLKTRKVRAGGDTFVEHQLTYTLDGVEKHVTFVPMPTTQATLGAGSVSCVTLLAADGKTVLMVEPTHFDLNAGLNPLEDAAIAAGGGVNRALAKKEYKQQKARFEKYGIRVQVVKATSGLAEQIYTRDTGYFFRKDAAGRGWDPTFGPAGGTSTFLAARLNHPARLGEVPAMRQALSL